MSPPGPTSALDRLQRGVEVLGAVERVVIPGAGVGATVTADPTARERETNHGDQDGKNGKASKLGGDALRRTPIRPGRSVAELQPRFLGLLRPRHAHSLPAFHLNHLDVGVLPISNGSLFRAFQATGADR